MEISFAQAGPISVADKARYGEWVEGMVPLLAAQTTQGREASHAHPLRPGGVCHVCIV